MDSFFSLLYPHLPFHLPSPCLFPPPATPATASAQVAQDSHTHFEDPQTARTPGTLQEHKGTWKQQKEGLARGLNHSLCLYWQASSLTLTQKPLSLIQRNWEPRTPAVSSVTFSVWLRKCGHIYSGTGVLKWKDPLLHVLLGEDENQMQ